MEHIYTTYTVCMSTSLSTFSSTPIYFAIQTIYFLEILQSPDDIVYAWLIYN